MTDKNPSPLEYETPEPESKDQFTAMAVIVVTAILGLFVVFVLLPTLNRANYGTV